jgi:hypothetical protein
VNIRNGIWRFFGWYGLHSQAPTYGVLVSAGRMQVWYGRHGLTLYLLSAVARRAGAGKRP